MAHTIPDMIDELCDRLLKDPPKTSSYGICQGEVGYAYLCAMIYDLTGDKKCRERCVEVIKFLSLKNSHITQHSLGYGKAGVYWLFSCLEKKGLITGAKDIIEKDAEILRVESRKLISASNMDYFSGALGILFTLNENDMLSEELFSAFKSKIHEKYSENNPRRLSYEVYPEDSMKISGVNLGVPHGLTGIVLFLLQIKAKTRFPVDDSIRLMLDLFIYIKHERMDGMLFPSFLRDKIADNRPSGLAWCYGNLAITYAFKKASILLDDPLYGKYADEILSGTINQIGCRYDNLTLCHGINTVALLFSKLYDLFGTEELCEAMKNWHTKANEVLSLLYESVCDNGDGNNVFRDPSLINGFPGTLLSFMHMDKSIKMDWSFLLL